MEYQEDLMLMLEQFEECFDQWLNEQFQEAYEEDLEDLELLLFRNHEAAKSCLEDYKKIQNTRTTKFVEVVEDHL